MHSENEPESIVSEINCTNRYSWGKVYVWINKMINFPYVGQIFIRASVQPWALQTKVSKDGKHDFKQGFYIPVASHFFTLKIELINLESVGFFSEKHKEHVLETYEIRIADINKDPFQKDGTLVLPLRGIADYQKKGLKLNDEPIVPSTPMASGANQNTGDSNAMGNGLGVNMEDSALCGVRPGEPMMS